MSSSPRWRGVQTPHLLGLNPTNTGRYSIFSKNPCPIRVPPLLGVFKPGFTVFRAGQWHRRCRFGPTQRDSNLPVCQHPASPIRSGQPRCGSRFLTNAIVPRIRPAPMGWGHKMKGAATYRGDKRTARCVCKNRRVGAIPKGRPRARTGWGSG